MQRRLCARFILLLLGVLAGCGGGGGGGSSLPSPGSTSTPAPSPSPNNSSSALTLSTPSLALGGTAQANTFGVSESGYTGSFTAQLDPSCSSIVSSVAPDVAPGPSATFTVTTGSSAGTCSLYVSDASGRKVALTISVAQVNGVLQ